MLVLSVIQYFIRKFIKLFLPLTKNLYVNTCTCSLPTKTQIPFMGSKGNKQEAGSNTKQQAAGHVSDHHREKHMLLSKAPS